MYNNIVYIIIDARTLWQCFFCFVLVFFSIEKTLFFFLLLLWSSFSFKLMFCLVFFPDWVKEGFDVVKESCVNHLVHLKIFSLFECIYLTCTVYLI